MKAEIVGMDWRILNKFKIDKFGGGFKLMLFGIIKYNKSTESIKTGTLSMNVRHNLGTSKQKVKCFKVFSWASFHLTFQFNVAIRYQRYLGHPSAAKPGKVPYSRSLSASYVPQRFYSVLINWYLSSNTYSWLIPQDHLHVTENLTIYRK